MEKDKIKVTLEGLTLVEEENIDRPVVNALLLLVEKLEAISGKTHNEWTVDMLRTPGAFAPNNSSVQDSNN